ncbi:MAG: hypothetical protein LBV11_17425 [Bacillus cereus]|nr:hypothetical protein [Bacillus cereus]
MIEDFFDSYNEFSDIPYISTLNYMQLFDDEDVSPCSKIKYNKKYIIEIDTAIHFYKQDNINNIIKLKGIITNNIVSIKIKYPQTSRVRYYLCQVKSIQEGLYNSCLVEMDEIMSFMDKDIIYNSTNLLNRIDVANLDTIN